MTVAEGILIFVTLFTGPGDAVQAAQWIERRRAKRRGKDHVFRTLMATRAARVSTEHVQALNMIDLECSGGGPKEKAVREACRQYLDHLNTRYKPDALAAWGTRQNDFFNDFFIDLLYEMSNSLGYDFEKTHIKNSIYLPVAHGNLEQEQTVMRTGLVNIFTGKAAFPVVAQAASEEEAKEQAQLRKLLTEYLSGKTPQPVRIVADLATPSATAGVVEEPHP